MLMKHSEPRAKMKANLRLAVLLVLAIHCLTLSAFPQTFRLAALVTRHAIDLNGHGIEIDSFDSSWPGPSADSHSISATGGDSGDVISNGGITNTYPYSGGATIYGHVSLGPDGVLPTNGFCAIGSHLWQASHTGIEPGWATRDANFAFPVVSLPDTTGYSVPLGGSAVIATTNTVSSTTYPEPGTYVGDIITNIVTTGPISRMGIWYIYQTVSYATNNYDHILSPNGNYIVAALIGKTVVLGTNVTLVLTNGLSLADSNTITIVQGAGITVYVGGGPCVVDGAGIDNRSGLAASFILNCASSVTSLTLAGSGNFTGVVTAPDTHVTINGDSSYFYQVSGALIADSVTLNGGVRLRYDESLFPVVSSPPLIVTQLENKTVNALQSVTLGVAATGSKPLFYHWLFATNAAQDPIRIPWATNATLTLSRPGTVDAGLYSVVVSNEFGTAVSSATLSVICPPAILGQPFSRAVPLGGNSSFSISADGTPPLAYQWYFSDLPVLDATNSSIAIHSMQSNYVGSYRVVVTNSYGSCTSSIATLTVASPPDFLWARVPSANSLSPSSRPGCEATSIAIDPSGGVLVAGTFRGSPLILDSFVLEQPFSTGNSGDTMNFLCKYDSSGALLWARKAGETQSKYFFPPARVASDGLGNAYLTGTFIGPTELCGITLTNQGMFVAKFNGSGQVLWVKQFSLVAQESIPPVDPGYESRILGFAVDPDGNAVVSSDYVGSADFGTVTLTNGGGFLAKYGALGNLLWANNSTPSQAIAAGPDGSIYIGEYGNLLKRDQAGRRLWSKPFPVGKALALDGQGNIYSTGYGSGTWDGLTLTNVGGLPDFFVAKGDPAGKVLWVRQVGSTHQQCGTAIAVDAFGGVYVTGASVAGLPDPALAFGATTLTNVYSFVAQYDWAGNALWAKTLAKDSERTTAQGIGVAGPGAVYLAGNFYGNAHFGTFSPPVSGEWSSSLFLAGMAVYASAAGTLELPARAGGSAQLQFNVSGVPGLKYALQASTNLIDWAPLMTNTAPFLFQETGTASFPQRYYRSVYVP
jgi:hypothetical protein